MRKYAAIVILFVTVATMMIAACSKVPVTGRKQLNILPEATIASMSLSSYQEVLKKSHVIKTGSDAEMVREVGKNISQAVKDFLVKNKQAKRVGEFKWAFNLIDENVANAWCMPGGKVAFYTGILPYTKSETGMAVVMGHEVAHAVARHGNERMSQGLIQQLGGLGLAIALRDKPAQTQNLFLQAYGVGSQVAVMLPFSRKHESEADELGLIFMAMAGYNPKESTAFWQRMSKAGGGQAPPEFLSTHPSNSTRISQLNSYMTTAMKYYNAAPVKRPVGGEKYSKYKPGSNTNSKTNKGNTNTGGTKKAPTRSGSGGKVKPKTGSTSGSGSTKTSGSGSGSRGGSSSSGSGKTSSGDSSRGDSGVNPNSSSGPKRGKVKVKPQRP